jgi:beta-galactosidase GanA
LLSRIIKEAGIQPIDKLSQGVEITRRSDGNHTWTFLLNYSDEHAQVEVPSEGVNLLTGVNTTRVVQIEPKGVLVLQT